MEFFQYGWQVSAVLSEVASGSKPRIPVRGPEYSIKAVIALRREHWNCSLSGNFSFSLMVDSVAIYTRPLQMLLTVSSRRLTSSFRSQSLMDVVHSTVLRFLGFVDLGCGDGWSEFVWQLRGLKIHLESIGDIAKITKVGFLPPFCASVGSMIHPGRIQPMKMILLAQLTVSPR